MTTTHQLINCCVRDVPEEAWNLDRICGGVWTIFPHVSFAGDNGGGLISQLFPGSEPGTSTTVQNYFVATEPSDEGRAEAQRNADFLERVVRVEDYFAGLRAAWITGEIIVVTGLSADAPPPGCPRATALPDGDG